MNTYYNNSNPLTPGTVAKAEDLNTDRSALEAAFDKLPTEVELANVKGTTGSVQTQIDTLDAGKADINGETYTGAHDFTGATVTVKTTPTAANEATSKAYADNLAISGTLPDQAGNDGKFLQTSGGLAAWAAVPNASVDYQEFTTSGTWTKPAGALLVYVEAIGGGQGGNNETTTAGAGGGGGGAFASKTIAASMCGATEDVIVGGGGNGALAGSNGVGDAGGNSSFGSHLSARGGQKNLQDPTLNTYGGDGGGGEIGGLSTIPSVGRGGFSSGGGGAEGYAGGSCVMGGAGGGGAKSSSSRSGAGGISQNGGDGGTGNISTAKGGNGTAPGGGGGGSSNDGGGGDGADGIVRVWTLVEA